MLIPLLVTRSYICDLSISTWRPAYWLLIIYLSYAARRTISPGVTDNDLNWKVSVTRFVKRIGRRQVARRPKIFMRVRSFWSRSVDPFLKTPAIYAPHFLNYSLRFDQSQRCAGIVPIFVFPKDAIPTNSRPFELIIQREGSIEIARELEYYRCGYVYFFKLITAVSL